MSECSQRRVTGHTQCLHGMVRTAADTVPDHVAVRYVDSSDTVHVLTYSQLVTTSKTIERMVKEYTCPGSVVGVMCTDQLMLPAWLIGIMAVPAAFIPLSRDMPASRLGHLVAQLGINLILTDSQNYTILFSALGTYCKHHDICGLDLVCVVTKALPSATDEKRPSLNVDSRAYVITTSGTTGQPKMVHVPHSCIVPNIEHLADIYELTRYDTVYQAAPLTFDPSIVEIFTTLHRGATLLMLPERLRQNPRRLASVIHKYGTTVMQATPTLMSSMGAVTLSRSVLGPCGLRVLAMGGERCPRWSTLKSWRGPDNKTVFINLYGITEVSSWATYHVITEQDIGEIPLGKPLKDTVVELSYYRPSARGPCTSTCSPPDNLSELLIGGSVRQCVVYGGTEDVSMEMRHTGDIVKQDKYGVLWYIGRADDQVKLRGKRINLLELETVAEMCSDVTRAAAALRDVKQRGVQCLYLFVQPRNMVQPRKVSKTTLAFNESTDQSQSSTNNYDVIQHVKHLLCQHLPTYYTPSDIILTERMPLTSHGKVDKDALLAAYLDSSKPSVQADTSLQHLLIDQWQTVTGSEAVPDMDSLFLESGGDSVSAIQLAAVVQRHLGDGVPDLLEVILEQPLSGVLSRITSRCTVEAFISEKDRVEHTLKHNLPLDNLNTAPEDVEPEQIIPAKKAKETATSGYHALHINGSVAESSSYSEKNNSKSNMCLMSISRSSNYHHHRKSSSVKKTETSSVLQDVSVTVRLCERWRCYLNKCVDSSPLLCLMENGEDIAVVGSHSAKHSLTAVDLRTGETKWTRSLQTRIEASPALTLCGTSVLVGGYDGTLYVVNLETGQTEWTFQCGGSVKSSPCVDPTNGLVYFGSHDHHVYCLDIQACRCVWSVDVDASVFATPCVSAHCVYVCTLAGKLYCLKPLTGQTLWTNDLTLPIFSSPALTPEGVCVASVSGIVHNIDHAGNTLWKYNTFDAVFCSPCVITSPQHITTAQQRLPPQLGPPQIGPDTATQGKCPADWCHANGSSELNPIDNSSHYNGQPDRKRKLGTNDYSRQHTENQPEENVTGGDKVQTFITIGNQKGDVYCISGGGLLLWRHTMPSKVYSSPFVYVDAHHKRLVAVSCSHGALHILDQLTGTMVAETTVGVAEVYSSPVVYQDKLVVGSRDNHLYCYDIHCASECSNVEKYA